MPKWYENPLTMLAMALAGAGTYVLIARDETQTIKGTVSDVFTRGSKVTSSTMGSNGVIIEDPLSLVGVASVMVPGTDADRYSLARMIRSEGADQGEIRGHVALNDLADLGWAKGRYGQQHSIDGDGNGQTRRYSTSKDPYEGDLAMAAKVINDHQYGIDPTGGAVKFTDGIPVIQAWLDDGLVAYTLPQYGDDLLLYRKA